jgi:hypothetical protein
MEPPFMFKCMTKAYDFVMGPMPQFLKERDVACPFALGYGAGFGLTWLTQKGCELTFTEDFYNKYMPVIERTLATMVLLSPFVYACVDPHGARELMSQFPGHIAGTIGGLAGGASAAYRHAYKITRPESKKLSDIVRESIGKVYHRNSEE